MKVFTTLLLLLLTSTGHTECLNKIAESEIPRAINLEPNAGAKRCGGADPCVCFDGVDWETAAYVNGKFSVDSAKVQAKSQRIAELEAKRQARAALEERLKNADLTNVNTIVGFKAVLKDLLDSRKD